MAEKKHYWSMVWRTAFGALKFGVVDKTKTVTSSSALTTNDGRHFIDQTEDGTRKGWTTVSAPGCIQLDGGLDTKAEDHTVWINAHNGDVVIRSARGKVRIEGVSVEITATGADPEGNFIVKANENAKIEAKNTTINSTASTKLLSTGALTLNGKLGMQLLAPICNGATAATQSRRLPNVFGTNC